jgi:hypothetical protein
MGGGEDVVVGGDDDGRAGGADAGVSRLGEAGDGVFGPDDGGIAGGGIAGGERSGESGGGVVIDDDDLEGVGGLLEGEGVEATGEGVGAVEGCDHDGDFRGLRGWVLGQSHSPEKDCFEFRGIRSAAEAAFAGCRTFKPSWGRSKRASL